MKEKARRVIDTFPSCHELMNNHGLYRIDKILFKSEVKKHFRKNEWEGVALAADKISSYMNGRLFWEVYDFDSDGKGSARVLTDRMTTVEVDFDTFRALIILFYISSIDFRPNKEQYLSWREFTDDGTMRKILEQA
jgi:hypothetical protein